ncbi:hypothetical protein MLAC_15150 [Mycobacterium lacus]|uniref:Uncharacterized protein n=1 Tax=Mycobacterium lacus TaxID=169765 RepID=A0A7I7NKJ5_9MYCO|nr:hypothetical protein MLAC_15150 [Mycobacterium lacus]
MIHRTSGDTLASNDRVAMTPTVQPAAAGTHRYREAGLLSGRDFVTVTDREDIPPIREMPGVAPCPSDRFGVHGVCGGRRPVPFDIELTRQGC